MPGTLFVVATPIGNLEDITLRALRVLREVDLIACEDTRHTRKLLVHYGIDKPTISYHEHNEAERAQELIERLLAGTTVALVSDAGTPLISDPGFRLVLRAVQEGINIDPLPGPSAIMAALAGSGLPTDVFIFAGFPPPKSNARKKWLARYKDEPATLVFYEAPHRLLETLSDIDEVLGTRPAVVARELTKIHQEFLRGTAAEVRKALTAKPSLKGEITVLVGKPDHKEEVTDDRPLPEAVSAFMQQGMSRMDAMKIVARQRGVSKRDVYRALEHAE